MRCWPGAGPPVTLAVANNLARIVRAILQRGGTLLEQRSESRGDGAWQ